jgi:hypothetical protein
MPDDKGDDKKVDDKKVKKDEDKKDEDKKDEKKDDKKDEKGAAVWPRLVPAALAEIRARREEIGAQARHLPLGLRREHWSAL